MELSVVNKSGEPSSESLELADETFAVKYNEPLIHQVVTAYLSSGRAGTHAQKTRAEARGGGAKPWRQKGTGRARSGTIRSPIWKGGGKAFAAKPRDYSQKVNKKMYRSAMRSLISELIRQERLVVVDEINVEKPRTKLLVSFLNTFGLDNVLILTENLDLNLALAARNLYNVMVNEPQSVDPVSLLRYEKVLVTVGAIRKLEERFA